MNSSNHSYRRNNKIRLSQYQSSNFKSKLLEYQKYFKSQQIKFYSSKTINICYIVSITYLKQFKKFCLSSQLVRELPNQMNYDLMDPAGVLKQNLKEKQHYEILTELLYNFVKLSGYEGIVIKRQAIHQDDQKIVPLYEITVMYMINQQSKKKGSTIQNGNHLKIWAEESIQNLINKIRKEEQIDKKKQIKLQLIKNSKQRKQLKNLNQKIYDLKLQPRNYFIVNITDTIEKIYKCSFCDQKLIGNYLVCKCQSVGYCNQFCELRDKQYHVKFCKRLKQQDQQNNDMIKKQNSLMGRVGLCNLGNTCFMNSCLQCLSNTLPLTTYFLSKYYQKQVNKTNPLGSKGKLVQSYAQLIRNMWYGTKIIYNPSKLKNVFENINKYFQGHNPHDSQQFFTFLVDGIHEDLNRVINKPYVQQADSKNKKDAVVAFQSWVAYIKRNQSIIVDLMTGQCKSKVICPKCKHQSITFDPFTTISLQIPKKITVSYIVLFKNRKYKKMSFTTSKLDLKLWLEKAVELLQRQTHEFVFYLEDKRSEDICCFQSTPKNFIVQKMEDKQVNIYLLELTEEQQKIKQKVSIVARFCARDYSQIKILSVKRPYFFEKNKTTINTLYKRFIRQLFNIYKLKNEKLQQFENKMLKTRLLTLIFKFEKTYKQYFNQIKFHKKQEFEDNVTLSDIFETYDMTRCQLDIIFPVQNIQKFDFRQWLQFDDQQQEPYKSYSKIKEEVTLDQCLELFSQTEQLELGNQWFCPKCEDHRQATKKMQIYKAPQILILHLKRFKNKNSSKKLKSLINVDFPLNLDLKKYVIDPTPMLSYVEQLKKQHIQYKQSPFTYTSKPNNPLTQYQLYAVNSHEGGITSYGHYIAYAQNDKLWLQYDDTKINETSEKQIKNSGAYMLFYKRKGCIKFNNLCSSKINDLSSSKIDNKTEYQKYK